MSDKPVIDAAMIKRAQDAHCCSNPECIRKVLEAALNPPPEPQVVVTEEMRSAGAKAFYEYPVQMPYTMEHVYKAMHALAPMPEVTMEAVDAAWASIPKYGFSRRSIEDALTAALPILLGRKVAEPMGVPQNFQEPPWFPRMYKLGAPIPLKDPRTGPKDRRMHGRLGSSDYADYWLGRRTVKPVRRSTDRTAP